MKSENHSILTSQHEKLHLKISCLFTFFFYFSFSISQRHLESHMLIHTDQKPFQCDACEQSFRQKQLLKRHQNLYHNPNYIPPTPKVIIIFNEKYFNFPFFLFFVKSKWSKQAKRTPVLCCSIL